MKNKMMAMALCVVTAVSLGGCGILESGLGALYFLNEGSKQISENSSGVEDIMILDDPGYGGYVTEMESDGEWLYEAYQSDGTVYLQGYDYSEPDWNTEEYKYYEENDWLSAKISPFSTFAADVDTASYANLRRMLLGGQTVPADAVRIEEMLNYFDYGYPSAKEGEPFSVTTQIAPCPWNAKTQLMMIGLKAKEIHEKELPASNLVFLIDVSGSMDEYNKLPLVQRAFRLLINELGEDDRVSIVTYANNDTVVLTGASGSEKTLVCDAVGNLKAEGGTNGSDGLVTAYQIAEEYFIEGGNNRVILATDGDLNIGMTDEGSLTRLIEEKAKSGVYLSVLGFGQGNISDTNMEALADHGNGNYSYIDSIGEARKVLVQEAGGTLFTVAKDVKLQVEFNPKKVKGYRLIGYENRTMSAESFADDTKDGGEIGSGHTVTALYEIASVESDYELPSVESKYSAAENQDGIEAYADEWATLHIRYKEPEEEESILMDHVIDDSVVSEEMDDNLSWAAGVAQAGMVLKDSEYAGTTNLQEVRERLKAITGNDEFREEFVYMMSRMEARAF